MNSRREMFGRRRGLGAEGRNRFNVFRGRREGPRAPGLAHDSGLPQTGRGHPEPQSYRFESEAKLEAIVSGGAEMPGGRGEASSLAKERKVVLCSVVNFSIETMLKDHSTYQLARGLVKIPRQESYTANVPAAWAEVVQAPRGRGVLFPTGTSSLFPGFMESQQASATAQQPTRPKSRRAWEERKRAREASKLVSQKAQWSSSDNETSEEYQRKPRRKPQKRLPRTVSLRRQAESESPKESEGLSGSSGDHDEDMPSYPLTTFSLELKTNKEKQRRLEETSCKTKQSVTRDYPGAVAAAAAAPVVAAAAAGDMPRACPTKTVAEKKLIVGPSRVTLGRNIPSWRQTMKAPPVVPPISDISPFGSSKASSSLHAGPKQYKKGNNQKRFGSWGRRNSSSVSREGDEAKRNPALQAQVPKFRPNPSSMSIHGGEISSGHRQTRDSPVQMKSQPFSQRQRRIPPTGPATSGYQEPPVHHRGPASPQQPCGQPGCSRCAMLRMNIENPQESVDAIQALTEKFQSLGE